METPTKTEINDFLDTFAIYEREYNELHQGYSSRVLPPHGSVDAVMNWLNDLRKTPK